MIHLLILASYAPSLVNFRGPLIRDIVAAGHRVSVGAPDIDVDLRRQIEALGANVFETPLRRNSTGIREDLRYFWSLRRLMKQLQPDLVLTYTIKPNIWGAFAASHCDIPSLAMVTGLGYVFIESGRASAKQRVVHTIARLLYRAATKRSHRVIFQNPDDCADFIEAGCLADPSKARLVNGSGVDLVHYSPAPLPERPIFLMIARLLVNKGVREYSHASLALRARHPGACFRLVGGLDQGPDGISRAELDAWIAQGLEYLGPLADVRPALAEALVYVLPSYREGTPRTVLEAMAMGRPVITTDAPGCRETIVDGESGLLVPVRDSDALATAMERFIDEPGIAERMGAAALQRVAAKYDVNKINAVMLAELGL